VDDLAAVSCPNLILISDCRARCRLASGVLFAAPGQPNSKCDECRGEWTKDVTGKPISPTVELPTPTVAELLERSAGKSFAESNGVVGESVNIDYQAKENRRLRRPHHCDHSGKLLRTGRTCGDKVYACGMRDDGEATCETCRGCELFTPCGT